jgi:glutamyl-tRNA(Gln) amidotransferase subunit E
MQVEDRIDYEEVGLIAGLEVHQQLLTDHKLFCRCPAGLYTEDHDGEVLRHMRPTLSELGEYDGTALMEFKTRKNIIYLLNQKNVCTYEMDDTPPFLMNPAALDTAVEQCLMLGCDIVDEVHVARKQYLDGSIPTGFQRTAIVGVNGKLPFLDRELSITQVSVEEDSCREVSDEGHLIVWRTDRLGIPLIETVTGPDLRTPGEVVEAILLVGRVCRSTGHVRVGMGASRQDVNVSVRGGRRVEIKGVPQASWARGLVHGEAVRQTNLLKLRDELRRRGFEGEDDLRIEHRAVTGLVADSALDLLRADSWERFVREGGRRPGFEIGEGGFEVRALRLVGLEGTLSWPTQPEHTFSHELAGRVRVVAGLDQQPILLHSEKWPDYRGSRRELRKLRRELGCGSNDTLVVVWGPREDTITAADEIRLRYCDALDGIPNETRQPFPDGSTDFERILPGPDRMYPDTDSPPTRMTRDRVERLRAPLPPPPWVREKRWEAAGVQRQTVRFLIRRTRIGAELVDDVVENSDADPRRACLFFGEQLKGLRRVGVPVDEVGRERWRELFELCGERPVLWEAWREITTAIAAAPQTPVAETVLSLELGEAPGDWKKTVGRALSAGGPDHDDGSAAKRLRFYMGRAMSSLRGRVPGREVSRAVAAGI